MKLAILTQPLKTNYGGLLQAYALQTILKRLGHEVLIVDLHCRSTTLMIKLLSIIKRLFQRYILLRPVQVRVWPTIKEQNIISQNTGFFIRENIQTTQRIYALNKISIVNRYGFNGYIVGSDQVWRPRFSPNILAYYLNFTTKRKKIKRIAYAASFGVDNWEYTAKLTAKCSHLIKQFDAISVREGSAIKLCKEYMSVDATHVLDPTMLLDKGDYVALVEKENLFESKGNLMTYILDYSSENNTIIKRVADELNLIAFSVMPKAKFEKVGKKYLNNCIFPPITVWIRGFMDAEYVITDSFHGTVLSIIFNKRFIVIGNEKRGLARFNSLLRIFHLENRLISTIKDLDSELINAPIAFDRVNQIRKQEQKKAMEFIVNALDK